MAHLPPVITGNTKYKRSRKRNKGFFWQHLYRVVKECARENPRIDTDVTIQRMLDMDWEVYDTPTDFLRSYDMERDLPSIYSCFTAEERMEEVEMMAEEEERKELHERRLERARELLERWNSENWVEKERAASELIKNYRVEVVELSEEGDVIAGLFMEEYGAFIKSYELLKDEIGDLEAVKKRLEKNLREIKKREETGVRPTPTSYSKEIMDKLNRIEKEIAKLKKEKEKIPFAIFEKTPPPSIPSNVGFMETVEYGPIDLECRIYSGYVYTLSPLYKDVAIKTGEIRGPIIKMLKIVEQRREKEDWMEKETWELIDEDGNTYIVMVHRDDIIINAPFARVPYVWVPEDVLSAIASIRGGASKGHIRYLKECVYHYVDNPLIEYIMRGMRRAHTNIMRIDKLIERDLEDYGDRYKPYEIEYLMRFLNEYEKKSAKCKTGGGGFNFLGP